MQVMPSTASNPGYGITPTRNDSPEEYNRVGREYRAALLRQYGSLAKMWAAYNWGPGNLDQAIRRHGDAWFQHAPASVQSYVMSNLRAAGS
jgi:soluble lytic murein transglycosylase